MVLAPRSIGRTMSMAASVPHGGALDGFAYRSSQPYHPSNTLPDATKGRWTSVQGPPLRAVAFQNRAHINRSELDVRNKTIQMDNTVNEIQSCTAYPITMLKVHAQSQPLCLYVTFCLDRSGSMGPYMQKTIHAAKTILHGLMERVTQQKLAFVHVTILSFGSRVEEHVHNAPLTTVDAMISLCTLLDDECSCANMGGTHIESALCKATSRLSLDIVDARKQLPTPLQQAAVQGYVILLTDGEPTSGEHCPVTIKQHLYNEYVGALPISFGAIALGTQPRRAFMEPLFEGGRFAFAIDEDALQEAFARITDGFDDMDRNLSLVVDEDDLVHGNISQSTEWVQVFDDLVHTESNVMGIPAHKFGNGLVQRGALHCGNQMLEDLSFMSHAPSDIVFAYTPWIYLVRGRKGAINVPPRQIELCMIQRFFILEEGVEAPIFGPPLEMVSHMALLKDQRLLQEAVASAWKDPTQACRDVNNISARAQMRSMSEPAASAARWAVVRRMSTQASEWIAPSTSKEVSQDVSPIKRMRTVDSSFEDGASPSAFPSLSAQATELMSLDLCSQSSNL